MAVTFAVFCETDGSLMFYKRNVAPSSGSTFEGKIATKVTPFAESNLTTDSVTWASNISDIVSVSFVDVISPKLCYNAFRGLTNLTSVDLSKLDTSNVTHMSSMFGGCSSLTYLDLSNFVTSKVTNMTSMFSGCAALTSLDLSSFDTSNVQSMDAMFNNCSSLTSLDISSFDTSNVTSMGSMFQGCSSLTSLNLSSFDMHFDTSNVTTMEDMFARCSALTSLDISSFDTRNVTDMNAMFYGCSALASLDLSSFDTSNVTNMNSMFSQCFELKTVYVSNRWSTDSVTSSSEMFLTCTKLVGGNGTSYKDNTHTYACVDTLETPGYFTYKARSRPNTEMLIWSDSIYGIIDAIETKIGPQPFMTLSQIADAIAGIETGSNVTGEWFQVNTGDAITLSLGMGCIITTSSNTQDRYSSYVTYSIDYYTHGVDTFVMENFGISMKGDDMVLTAKSSSHTIYALVLNELR